MEAVKLGPITSAAQQMFRTMLHEMRKSLGDALIVDRDMLSLAGTVDVDARGLTLLICSIRGLILWYSTHTALPQLLAVVHLQR